MKAKKEHQYSWQTQREAADAEFINCDEYDPYQDWKRDPSGFYILIKVNFANYRIELAVCDKNHKILAVFSGRKPQDIYKAIFDYEKKHKIEWFKEKMHIAYLGKELKKAEIALATGSNAYFQE